MPLDKSNGCQDALGKKLDLHNYHNLRPKNKKGKYNPFTSKLSSNDLVISCKILYANQCQAVLQLGY